MLPDDPTERFKEYQFLVGRIAGALAKQYGGTCRYSDLYHWGLSGLWDACRRYEGPADRFEYCCGVRIRGAIIDELRRASPFPRRMSPESRPVFVELDEAELADDSPPVDSVLIERETEAQVVARLSELTERERTIVRLYFWDGMRPVEISRKLNLSEPRIHQLKKAALEKLAAKSAIKKPRRSEDRRGSELR